MNNIEKEKDQEKNIQEDMNFLKIYIMKNLLLITSRN